MAPLTQIHALPTLEKTRWVARRKALIVAAVRGGRITLEEARRRYALSIEEFLLWQRTLESAGVAGLKATASQRGRGQRGGRSRKAGRARGEGGETIKPKD